MAEVDGMTPQRVFIALHCNPLHKGGQTPTIRARKEGITVAPPILDEQTARIARYLESDLVYHQTEYIALVWAKLGLPKETLENELRGLMYDVRARANGNGNGNGHIKLDDVDWSALAERYAGLFSSASP